MPTYHLREWSVVTIGGPYDAPELCGIALMGRRAEDGKAVRTSNVATAEGIRITTTSGSVYMLEDVDPRYEQYLRNRGTPLNPLNPITVHS
jgi:hypothetical protein